MKKFTDISVGQLYYNHCTRNIKQNNTQIVLSKWCEKKTITSPSEPPGGWGWGGGGGGGWAIGTKIDGDVPPGLPKPDIEKT